MAIGLQESRLEMLVPFPDSARIEIPSEIALKLLAEAERLPLYDNKEFYSSALQSLLLDHFREACGDRFEFVVSLVRKRIAQWPYCVLIRGLRFDQGNRLFVAINRAFGELVALPYQAPRAQLVHYIQHATDIRSPRGGREVERLHTDTADWEVPVGLISMLCVRADPDGGGRSRILDVDAVRGEVKERLGTETLKLLETEPVPWQLAPCFGGGLKWRTVLTESGMCWRRYSIDLGLEVNGAPLADEMLTSLDAFEEVISASTRTIDFLMQEGELLFSDNLRTIHARTPITAGDASDRLMIRSWIRTS